MSSILPCSSVKFSFFTASWYAFNTSSGGGINVVCVWSIGVACLFDFCGVCIFIVCLGFVVLSCFRFFCFGSLFGVSSAAGMVGKCACCDETTGFCFCDLWS